MTRVLLLLALLAVGYDAYAFQGAYTREAVAQVEIGIKRLSALVSDYRSNNAPPSTPPDRPLAP